MHSLAYPHILTHPLSFILLTYYLFDLLIIFILLTYCLFDYLKNEVRTLNERALATGGALYRPQNKSYQSQRQGILQTNNISNSSSNNDNGSGDTSSGGKGVTSSSSPSSSSSSSLPPSSSTATTTSITALQGFEHRPFVDFLQHCQLSSHLQRVITHALCLHAR